MRKIRIAIIGLGYWGPNHLRVLAQCSRCEITAVCDRSEQSLTKLQSQFGTIRTFSEYKDLFLNTEIDAVVIATPTSTHYDIVKDALERGLHVLCEKPLCLQSIQGSELIELAKAKQCCLMVGHIFLFNQALVKVRQYISEHEIGDLRYMSSIRTNLGPIRNDVNAAWDLASHDIAVFNWMVGEEPIEVKAMGASFLQEGIEDVVDISLRYSNGVVGSIKCSWLDPVKVRSMTFVGSSKMITWDDLNMTTPVAIYEKSVQMKYDADTFGEFLKLSMHDGDIRLPKIVNCEPLKTQADEFLNAIEFGRRPVSDGVFANGIVKTLERVQCALSVRGS